MTSLRPMIMIYLLSLYIALARSVENGKHLKDVTCSWTSTENENSKGNSNTCTYDNETGTLKLHGTINWLGQDNPEDLGYPSACYRVLMKIDCKQNFAAFYTLNEEGFRKHADSRSQEETKTINLWVNFQVNGKLKFILVEESEGDTKNNNTLFLDATECTFASLKENQALAETSQISKSAYLGKNDTSTFTIAPNRTCLFVNVGNYSKDILNFPEDDLRSAVTIATTKANYNATGANIRRFKDSDGHLEKKKMSAVLDSENAVDPFFYYIQGYENDFTSFGLLIVSWSGFAYDEEYIYFKRSMPSDEPVTTTKDGGLSGGAIAGIVVASVAVVSAGVVGTVFIIKKKAKVAN